MGHSKKRSNKSKFAFCVIAIFLISFGVLVWILLPRISFIYAYLKNESVSESFSHKDLQSYVDLPFPDEANLVKGHYLKNSIDYSLFLKFEAEGFTSKFCESLRKEGWDLDEGYDLKDCGDIDFEEPPEWWRCPEGFVFFARNIEGNKNLIFYEVEHAVYLHIIDS